MNFEIEIENKENHAGLRALWRRRGRSKVL